MKRHSALRTTVLFMALRLASAEMGFEGGYWRRATSGGPSTFVIPLEMDKSGFYHSAVSMGSNQQKFNFSLSGSTGYTVVAGRTCTACGEQNPLYSSANSTTFHPLAELLSISVDGVNQVFGSLAKEDCALKRSDGNWWAYTNQTVLIANSVNDGTRDVFNAQISGIVGLHPTAKVHTAADTVLGAWLRKNPQAEKVSVGFALKRPGVQSANATATANSTATTNSTSGGGGEMHMLVPNTSSYVGKLSTIPTVSYAASGGSTDGNGGGAQMQAAGWVTNLEQWSFLNPNGEQVSGGKGAFAAVDPWYSGIVMPKAESENVFSKVPGAQLVAGTNSAQQMWNIPCNTRMNLTIKIAGLEFDIDPKDLIVEGEMAEGGAQKRQDALCPCNVQGWTDATVPGYMLGSSFMRNAYVVYNVAQTNSSQTNSIGFGQRHPFRLPSPQQSQRSRTIAIVVGSIAATLLFVGGAALAWLWRRNRLAHRAPSDEFVKGNSKRFEYGGLKSNSGFFVKGNTAIAPGVIFNARRGSDPEAYPLMQTPPTTSSPPRDGSRPKTFAHQQGPIVHVEDADRNQEIDHDAHQAYLDRLTKHAQGRGIRWSSSTGYSRVADQDVDIHAFGDHAQVYDDNSHEPDQRYDPPVASTWDQPYHAPGPVAGSRVSMVVEPITKPPEVAQKEEPNKAV